LPTTGSECDVAALGLWVAAGWDVRRSVVEVLVVLDVALAPAVTAERALDIGLLAVGVLVGGRVELGCGEAVGRRSRGAAVDAALAPGRAEDADVSPTVFEKRTLAPMATATSPTTAPATAERLTRTSTSLPRRRHLEPKPIVSRRHPRAARHNARH
jgi:hypothetical protein